MQWNEINGCKRKSRTASTPECPELTLRTLFAFQLTKANKLPHKRLGTRIVYPIEALKRFINEPESEN